LSAESGIVINLEEKQIIIQKILETASSVTNYHCRYRVNITSLPLFATMEESLAYIESITPDHFKRDSFRSINANLLKNSAEASIQKHESTKWVDIASDGTFTRYLEKTSSNSRRFSSLFTITSSDFEIYGLDSTNKVLLLSPPAHPTPHFFDFKETLTTCLSEINATTITETDNEYIIELNSNTHHTLVYDKNNLYFPQKYTYNSSQAKRIKHFYEFATEGNFMYPTLMTEEFYRIHPTKNHLFKNFIHDYKIVHYTINSIRTTHDLDIKVPSNFIIEDQRSQSYYTIQNQNEHIEFIFILNWFLYHKSG
jgi:hypothetical protein